MDFRKDINGLRAIAVLGVIIFHIEQSWLPGGFAGVDIFFVISGFLMTAIIFSGIEKNNFSILLFYKARAKRIIPGLAFLCLTLFIFGFFILPPIDFKLLAKHIAASLGFFSNFVYLNEINYFNDLSGELWLLHTWSLSVEWQFYLAYPLIILFLKKILATNNVKNVIYFLCPIFYLISIYISKNNPDASFYLLPARAWEMLAGGIAYLYTPSINNVTKKYLAPLGLILIAITYLFISPTDSWPGYLSAIPVIGTICIIIANQENLFISHNRITQTIGNFSYSAYLWHWPIILYFSRNKFDAALIEFLFILAIGYMAYFFIEKNRKINSHNRMTISITLACIILSIATYKLDGLQWRVDEKYAFTDDDFHKKLFGGAGYPTNIFFNIGDIDKKQPDLIMTGDSYGHQYSKSLDVTAKKEQIMIEALFDHGCIIFENLTSYKDGTEDIACSEEYKILIEKLSQNKTTPLVIAYSWDRYVSKSGLKNGGSPINYSPPEKYYDLVNKELEILIKAGGEQRQYFLIGVQQRADYNAISCLSAKGLLFSNPCAKETKLLLNPANKLLEEFSKKYKNIFYINPNNKICKKESCLVIYNDWPIHTDSAHLSVYGTDLIAPYILSEILLRIRTQTPHH